MPDDGARLLAQGVELSLSDGRAVRLRYTMRSLKAIEDRWESITDFNKSLSDLVVGRNPKPISTIVPALAVGLLHEGITEDALYDLTAVRDLRTYIDAISEALVEAFPDRDEGKAPAPEANGTSPGVTVTTSPPSATGDQTPSSGP